MQAFDLAMQRVWLKTNIWPALWSQNLRPSGTTLGGRAARCWKSCCTVYDDLGLQRQQSRINISWHGMLAKGMLCMLANYMSCLSCNVANIVSDKRWHRRLM